MKHAELSMADWLVYLKEHKPLQYQTVLETIEDTLTFICSDDGVIDAVLTSIPPNWEHTPPEKGGPITKRAVAWWYLFEQITTPR